MMNRCPRCQTLTLVRDRDSEPGYLPCLLCSRSVSTIPEVDNSAITDSGTVPVSGTVLSENYLVAQDIIAQDAAVTTMKLARLTGWSRQYAWRILREVRGLDAAKKAESSVPVA